MMMLFSGIIGFLLACALFGIIFLVRHVKKSTPSYKLLVEIDGVSFVLDKLLLEMIGHGDFDDYESRGIILNSMMQQCYHEMGNCWKEHHKERYARCGIHTCGDNIVEYTVTPINSVVL